MDYTNKIPILHQRSRSFGQTKRIADSGNEIARGEKSDESFSDYFKKLEPKFQGRYTSKCSRCDGVDPYCLKKKDFSYKFEDLPNIEFPDVCNYLVLQTSFYTNQQMKSYKSLEAYNYFVCGWVEDLGVKHLNENNSLIYARVSINLHKSFNLRGEKLNYKMVQNGPKWLLWTTSNHHILGSLTSLGLKFCHVSSIEA